MYLFALVTGGTTIVVLDGNKVLCQHQKLSMPPHENLVSDKWLRHLTGAGRPTLGTLYPRGQPRVRIICLFLWIEFRLRGAPNKTVLNGLPVRGGGQPGWMWMSGNEQSRTAVIDNL